MNEKVIELNANDAIGALNEIIELEKRQEIKELVLVCRTVNKQGDACYHDYWFGRSYHALALVEYIRRKILMWLDEHS